MGINIFTCLLKLGPGYLGSAWNNSNEGIKLKEM